MKDNLVHDAENHSYMGESKTPVIEASFTAVPPSVGTRTGLFRTLISGEVQSATCVHGLPRPALAVHNLMEQARFAHLCTVMSRMHHRRDGYPIGSLVDFAPDPLVVFTSYVLQEREMSSYENVVGGKLKLKGKPLDVIKAGGAKKKKKHKKHISQNYEFVKNDLSEGQAIDPSSEDVLEDSNKLNTEGNSRNINDHLTPAERRYLEQKEKIDAHRLAKTANKSHRDRIEDFNQYLANMSEHYDIPKVGPG